MRDLLFNTQFTAERLKIVAQKMANSIASIKRSGMKVVRAVFLELTYAKGTLSYKIEGFFSWSCLPSL